jgi:hypothetical protein
MHAGMAGTRKRGARGRQKRSWIIGSLRRLQRQQVYLLCLDKVSTRRAADTYKEEKFPYMAPRSSENPLNGPDASCVESIYIGYTEHQHTGGESSASHAEISVLLCHSIEWNTLN